jgi:hypothetical protein
MRFDRVKIIEDASGGEYLKSIKISKNYLFVGPVNIQAAEYWEEKLLERKVPYVLAQFETTISDNEPGQEDVRQRYARGYGIFICQNDISLIIQPEELYC